MKTNLPPLDRPASIPALQKLLGADALAPGEAALMEERIRRGLPWRLWLDRGLLVLGAALIVAGIGYFFAHNWQHITDDDKLGLSAGAVLAAFAGALWAGADRFIGKLLLLAASLLVGVFLAVFGQVYQTGADTYSLFLAWALFILPWVILGRFVPLWLCWLALLNLALGFYLPVDDYFFINWGADWTFRSLTVSLAVLNLLALLIREGAVWAKVPWLDRMWSSWILLTATLAPATVETTYEIVGTWDSHGMAGAAPLAVLVLAVLIAGAATYFFRVRPSLPALALGALSACWTLTVLAARVIWSGNEGEFSGQFLFMGILILAIFGGGVFLLMAARRRMPSTP